MVQRMGARSSSECLDILSNSFQFKRNGICKGEGHPSEGNNDSLVEGLTETGKDNLSLQDTGAQNLAS